MNHRQVIGEKVLSAWVAQYLRFERERYENHRQSSTSKRVNIAIHISEATNTVLFALCELQEVVTPQLSEERVWNLPKHSNKAMINYSLSCETKEVYVIRSVTQENIPASYHDLCKGIEARVKPLQEADTDCYVIVNDNGIAGNIVSVLADDYKLKIENVNLRDADTREKFVNRIREYLGFNRLQLADSIQHKEAIIEEASRYKRRETLAGEIVFDNQNGKHDDLVMVLGMSLDDSVGFTVEFGWEVIPY